MRKRFRYMSTQHDVPTPLSPTGEIHRDPITPWQTEQWARKLGIPEQQIRQLAAEVGPIFAEIERTWAERVKENATNDELRKAQRDGRLSE